MWETVRVNLSSGEESFGDTLLDLPIDFRLKQALPVGSCFWPISGLEKLIRTKRHTQNN
jgi:hypothetical protein